jgi:hypothetical protein
MHLAPFAGEAPRSGSADSPIIAFATQTTLRTIEITSTRIQLLVVSWPLPPSIVIALPTRDLSLTRTPQRLKPQTLEVTLEARVELVPFPFVRPLKFPTPFTTWRTNAFPLISALPCQYFRGRGGIKLASTASNSNFGSSASGAKVAFVVFIQFLSSRSGKSGL